MTLYYIEDKLAGRLKPVAITGRSGHSGRKLLLSAGEGQLTARAGGVVDACCVKTVSEGHHRRQSRAIKRVMARFCTILSIDEPLAQQEALEAGKSSGAGRSLCLREARATSELNYLERAGYCYRR